MKTGEKAKKNLNLSVIVPIIVAVIGCIGTIIASAIGVLPDILPKETKEIPITTIVTESTETIPATLTLTDTPQLIVSQPQKVEWRPIDDEYNQPGIRAINQANFTSRDDLIINGHFVHWSEIEKDLGEVLINQISEIPSGSGLILADHGGNPNWVIQVVDPNVGEIANVWIGGNPLNGYEFDGLIRVGENINPPEIWGIFQRYSDGTYQEK